LLVPVRVRVRVWVRLLVPVRVRVRVWVRLLVPVRVRVRVRVTVRSDRSRLLVRCSQAGERCWASWQSGGCALP
jgi:hypothetical protein